MLHTIAVALLAASACGIHFTIPKGWKLHVTKPSADVCAIGISPANWQDLVEKSRWPDANQAIIVEVIRGDLETAARAAGFFRGEDGKLWANERGREFHVTNVTYNGLRGYEACGWYRGFAKDGVELGDSSRIYSGTHCAVLLRRTRRSFIVMEYDTWSPDIEVDRPKAAKRILATIR